MSSGEPKEELGHAETISAALVERPEPDKLARAVARARVASALFAKKQEVRVGRYHLLEMVGSGGMGVVWGAWDPELDRRVAIKLVKAELAAARDRILIEGQALAKLSHPNVVPVYDVGVVDEQIYLVMEWVRGKNLRAYCRGPRTVREIVALYRAAGEGLAAAHRAGLIHRDFKPDNAMIGDDGRVRVLDFGLARSELAPSSEGDLTRGAGTPRYMPPEQAEGRDLTPAVDQFALGVALREALVGRDADGKDADVPRWLDAIIERATAADPAARFASMDELLAALARDPATVWRRRLVVAGVVAAAGIAFTVGTLRGGNDAVERCAGGKDEIARTWNPTIRATIVAHLRGLGPYGAAEAERLAGELDRYAASWAGAHRAACMAKERGELTPQLYERNLGCLARTQVALATAHEVVGRATLDRLPDAVIATRDLPDIERCLDDTQTSTLTPPAAAIAPQVAQVANEVERARVLVRAADPQAIAVAAAAAAKASELSYLPLVGRASLVHGFALSTQQQRVPALAAFERASAAAFEAGDGAIAVEATARMLYAIATIAQTERLPPNVADTMASITLVEAVARGLPPAGAFARALFFNNVGTVRFSRGDKAAAQAWFAKALAARSGVTGGSHELAGIPGNVAMLTTERRERDRLLAEESAGFEAALGPDHPETLDVKIKVAMFVEDPRKAWDLLDTSCRRYRQLHPHLSYTITHCAIELAWLAEERGGLAEAREMLAALSIKAPEAKLGAGYLLVLDDKPADAVSQMLALADRLQKQEHYWPRWRAVDALVIAARAAHTLGKAADEIAYLERALAVLHGVTVIEGTTYYQRRRARVRALLALRGAPDAAVHAAAALAWYRDAGGYDAQIAALAPIATSGR